jgi:hypothetical protein
MFLLKQWNGMDSGMALRLGDVHRVHYVHEVHVVHLPEAFCTFQPPFLG